MDLAELREQIDRIDEGLLRLFEERMDVSLQIGQFKKAHDLPVLDAVRERDKLNAIADKAGEELRPSVRRLYSLLFELSRAYQEDL